MQQPTLRKVVQKNNHNVNSLSAKMIQLEVVQVAVAGLLNKLDEITDKGWHEKIVV